MYTLIIMSENISQLQEHTNISPFEKQHLEYTSKHSDEIRPTFSSNHPPKVGIIFKSFREFTNGNFTEQLRSLSRQSVDPADFVGVFTVNNKDAHHMLSNDPTMNYDQAINDYYKGGRPNIPGVMITIDPNNPDPTIPEKMTHTFTSKPNKNFLYDVLAYRENQAMLNILRELTGGVNMVKENSSENIDMGKILENIETFASPFMDINQIVELLVASRSILKRKINLMGIDCSSPGKSYHRTNLGKAMNEGAHIALDMGVEYLDFRDLDQTTPAQGLEEIIDKITNDDPPDVFVRDYYVQASNHPEYPKFTEYTGKDLIDYFSSVPTTRQMFYQDPKLPLGTGTIICNKYTFERNGGYPEIAENEDFRFSKYVLQVAESVIELDQPKSMLRLADRSRDESYDGARWLDTPSDQAYAEHKDILDTNRAKRLEQLKRQNNTASKIINAANDPNLLNLYEERRKLFFDHEQGRRAMLRSVFLGIDRHTNEVRDTGLLAKVLYSFSILNKPEFHANLDRLDMDKVYKFVVDNGYLTPREKKFFTENPYLLRGLSREMILEGGVELKDKKAITNYLVNTLPEFFAEPLKVQPKYSTSDDALEGRIDDYNFTQIAFAYHWLYKIAGQRGIPIPSSTV